ncbi:MAG: LuxR family transcriptional regulator [Flavobacteriaceae bacterium]|nr:LuxR family transcriptional regulator [Flavobacteriaceae bacterium]
MIVFLIISGAQAQELPPVVNFPPEVYDADNQNWMISQSEEGFIYVANNKGLLEFTGARWKLYPTHNESIMRSVKVIGDSIFTGCYMNFGYWKRNRQRKLEYRSLSDTLGIEIIEDEQFWNIIKQQKWLLFQSLDRIILYNPETAQLKYVDVQNTITKIFNVNGEIFFHVINEGIYAIVNGEKELVNGSEIVKSNRVIGMFEVNDRLTFITEKNGFYVLDDNEVSTWTTASNDYLKGLTVYSAVQNTNGNFSLGTIANGLIHLDREGKLLYNITRANGLKNNTALSLFEDKDQNLWIGLDNGIDCVNSEAPLRNYVDQKGILGTTYASAVYNDKLYLGTNQGLFYRPVYSENDFEFVEGTEGQVWSLTLLDNELFVGHNSGTFLIANEKAELISSVQGTWTIVEIPGEDNLLLQGNYDGLYTLEKVNSKWQLRSKVNGFDISARHLIFAGNNSVIVNHEYKGVFELKLDTQFKNVISSKTIEELKKGIHSSVAALNGTLFYASNDGIFTRDTLETKFSRDQELSEIYKNQEYISGKLVSDKNSIWAFTRSFLYRIVQEKIDNSFRIDKISIPQVLRNEMEGFENITNYNNNNYIFGASYGYLVIETDKERSNSHKIILDGVYSNKLNGESRAIAPSVVGNFLHTENNFEFIYSVPEYEKYLITEYQYQLNGLHDTWSEWSDETSFSIKNLNPGTYQFNVRGRVNGKITDNIASYSFEVEKPYYSSTTALIIYLLIAILLVLLVNWLYKRYYRKQRERILEKTTNELKLKELASQKEIIELKNDRLNQDITARNRELAISTMNMISKNNTLNNIKEELNKLTDIHQIKPVIKLIDKRLNNKQDWEFFEVAFNHADKEFFKKVKSLHPDLTPNDLRLCVYLRLNLSSKEIAPLLNISPRSVETKRYRLRRKIRLEREISLNDYFINL